MPPVKREVDNSGAQHPLYVGDNLLEPQSLVQIYTLREHFEIKIKRQTIKNVGEKTTTSP